MASAARAEDAVGAQVLGGLGANGWVPMVASMAVMYLATGLGGLSTAALPKWLSITTVVLGVGCLLGPVGIAVYFATPLWLIVAGIVLSRSARISVSVPARTAPYRREGSSLTPSHVSVLSQPDSAQWSS